MYVLFNKLKPVQNGQHFADEVFFQMYFLELKALYSYSKIHN